MINSIIILDKLIDNCSNSVAVATFRSKYPVSAGWIHKLSSAKDCYKLQSRMYFFH